MAVSARGSFIARGAGGGGGGVAAVSGFLQQPIAQFAHRVGDEQRGQRLECFGPMGAVAHPHAGAARVDGHLQAVGGAADQQQALRRPVEFGLQFLQLHRGGLAGGLGGGGWLAVWAAVREPSNTPRSATECRASSSPRRLLPVATASRWPRWRRSASRGATPSNRLRSSWCRA